MTGDASSTWYCTMSAGDETVAGAMFLGIRKTSERVGCLTERWPYASKMLCIFSNLSIIIICNYQTDGNAGCGIPRSKFCRSSLEQFGCRT